MSQNVRNEHISEFRNVSELSHSGTGLRSMTSGHIADFVLLIVVAPGESALKKAATQWLG